MRMVRLRPTLANPRHSHARRRRPNIPRDNSSTEGCQCQLVMETPV